MKEEIFLLLGAFFGLLFILQQYVYYKNLKRLEKKFMSNMIKAIEKLEWRE